MSSNMRTRPRFASRFWPALNSTTNNRPFSSNAIATGAVTIGSEATNSMRKPRSIRKGSVPAALGARLDDDAPFSAACAMDDRQIDAATARNTHIKTVAPGNACGLPPESPNRRRKFNAAFTSSLVRCEPFDVCSSWLVAESSAPRQLVCCSPLAVPIALTSFKHRLLKREKTSPPMPHLDITNRLLGVERFLRYVANCQQSVPFPPSPPPRGSRRRPL